ncbi:MAG: UDP-3-O-(3-hydroxymyristoyl)glucosamine N-acyltransferase, partial [Pyrinomonadaceae bacterium]
MKTQEIADFLSAELIGDGTVEISGIASLASACENDLAFVDRSEISIESSAGCLLVPSDFKAELSQPFIRVNDPKLAFTVIANKLRKTAPIRIAKSPSFIAESANVKTLQIGSFVTIGEGSVVGEDCRIGDGVSIGNNVIIKNGSVIFPNSVIYDDVKIGAECVIHAGSVIGSDGFGYIKDDQGEHLQFPQVGTVEIGDRVEIGANCTIDRGSLGTTRIGHGTKIDNMVHIAHNVQIGKRVLIAGQSGIAGSSVVEDDVVIAGQVGIADHVTIRAGAVIAAKSAVFPNKIIRKGVWAGIPVRPIKDYARQNADLKGLH